MRPIFLFSLIVGSAFNPTLALPQAHPEGRLVTSERGTCIEGPHQPLRTRRFPGTAVMSDRHPEPHEDAYVHCSAPAKEKGR